MSLFYGAYRSNVIAYISGVHTPYTHPPTLEKAHTGQVGLSSIRSKVNSDET